MTHLIVAVVLTIGISAFCSVLEAMVLSTSSAETETIRNKYPKRGKLFGQIMEELDDTISAILTLNTVANTAGASVVGTLAADIYGSASVGIVAGLMTFLILIFSEIIPKNLGVAYRSGIQSYSVYPLWLIRILMRPVTFFTRKFVRLLVKEQQTTSAEAEEEIKLLAEKGAKEGKLRHSEANVISNTLTLDDLAIDEIMTPRTVVFALEDDKTLGEIFKEFNNIPFARIPVYKETIDNVIGVVRRRDLLHGMAEGGHDTLLTDMVESALFVPETANGADTLQSFLAKHQQIAIVVDEFGSMTGVVTMEDIIEHILGREIFEKDDVAIDMRELARTKNNQRREKEMKKALQESAPKEDSANS
ncbi:MAG: hemolysin family protein [Verrucomicrobia bacterium]|nr:hemolysin family protein [Verrucomicrobiota bacterium]MDA1065175.1 hemolysin family protein [Verrucomicrobiota bacterium]